MILRFLDILLSSVAIMILFPLLVPIMLVLKFSGEGEVFYLQERVGYEGKHFKLFKFATMLKDSPNMGTKEITINNDPRVLPFGVFLRKTKLNELPQLWNILVGDMSIVGPRPMVPRTYDHYSLNSRSKLSKVRPGLTGIGSIIFRDEEKYLANRENPMDFYKKYIIPYKSELEIWFVNNLSLLLYCKIILVTAWVVLFSSSKIPQKTFKDLPKIPTALRI